MTLKEIKLAREVWPPNIEKILEHYENAKKIMPSNYEIYKDKARLFYVLREYRKFHEEIKQWKKIADGKWSKYIEEEIDFLTTTNRSKITPWEHFERYFEKPKMTTEEIKLDDEIDFTDDENILFMYYDHILFDLIRIDIEKGVKHTTNTILKKYPNFQIFFKYWGIVDDENNSNFKKLYEYSKVKAELKNSNQIIFKNSNIEKYEFSDFFRHNLEYLEKWTRTFCNCFVIIYEHLNGKPLNKNIENYVFLNNKISKVDVEQKKNLQKPDISDCCRKIIANFRHKPELAERNVELMEDMSNVYEEVKSLKQISEFTHISLEVLRNDFRTLSRVPKKLKLMIDQGKLNKDHILSVEIALFATDYYFWDGENEKQSDVIQLAIDLNKFFTDPLNLNLKKEFFNTTFDITKPIANRIKTEPLRKQKKIELNQNFPINPSTSKRREELRKNVQFTVIQGEKIPVTKTQKRSWEKNTTEEQRNDPNFKTSFGQEILDRKKLAKLASERVKKRLQRDSDK